MKPARACLTSLARQHGSSRGRSHTRSSASTDLLATCRTAIVGRDLPRDAGPDSFNILPALLDASPAQPVRTSIIVDSAFRSAIYP